MGFEKFGISISKEVFDFARTGRKSFLSAMHYNKKYAQKIVAEIEKLEL